ncbi:GMC oxidoreductase-domain-containing protein [Lasiosphaeria miniovina]|uniref:GMC oxidoreductase-domain-containing protein n=1 Tax=Lasiosphaeria miniovina TaxID=1954250 RepID=A0AA40AKH6_9PEZI|nr:GMC oxidoreductase-domain-containing protein [Lasiosphaeria miniovina]KAK0717435.1 GMC oxidoreductase-domain-containing protein [Lasiosphaeria miniovina]
MACPCHGQPLTRYQDQHLLPENKAKELAGRAPVVSSGGVLGGGSLTNLVMYSRAQRSEFDSWKTPGWSAEDMLPYLRKSNLTCSSKPITAQARKTATAMMAPSTSTFTVHPYSRGHIHITGPELGGAIDFETGFFSDPRGLDIRKQVWAYKKQREVVRRMAAYRGEVAGGHPPFAAASGAACVEKDGPLAGDVQDIKYTATDDAVIEQLLRESVGTTWPSLGTCKMGPYEKCGVVDARLGVYGIEGLKIADLSVLPGNVTANTNNTALTVGEKAADIFIEELGLGRVVVAAV